MHAVHKNKQGKRKYLYIIVILVAIIVLDPFSVLGFVRGITSTLFLPFNHIGQNLGESFGDSFDVVLHMGDMHRDNQRLIQENQDLRAELMYLTDIKNENNILRTELGLLPRKDFELIYAEVVVRDSLGGDQWVMINVGAENGVKKDMAVIVGAGVFVGYIDTVDQKISRVRLITHPESVVNVVNADSGAEAISRGRYGLSVVVEDIKKGDKVQDGDMFVTSQIGNKFPRGFSVGVAQNVALSNDDLFQRANIIPLVSLDDIRFVSVVKK
ncbi:MAG: rod shape-determining protein MreC [Candidatus Moraniibacteriota bacterium]|nr:MAG: rod shape-determining protein MreC [Candidatus Moranbacteria bacterium]